MVQHFIGVYIIKLIEHYMVPWRYKISLHSFAALTHEIFVKTRREISYLHAAM